MIGTAHIVAGNDPFGVEAAVRRLGLEVVERADGVDLVIVVVGDEGTELERIDRLRRGEATSEVPVMALFSHDAQGLDGAALACGANDIALLPMTDDELSLALERVIRPRRISLDGEPRARRNEALARLAGGVANDLNNLLTVIVNRTRLAMDTLEEAAPAEPELEAVLAAANTASALVDKLLAFSRRRQANPRVVDLNSVVSAGVAAARPRLAPNIRVVVEFGELPWFVEVDPALLRAAIGELVVNGAEAMPDGGCLRVSTQLATIDLTDAGPDETAEWGTYLSVEVVDEGVGMDEATRARVFEPFFTTRPGGTGLGLSSTYGVVKQAGGFIRVRSEPGRGSSFHVYLLPTSRRPSDKTLTPTQPPVRQVRSDLVLLVEDNAALRSVVTRLLSRAGYGVLEASHGAEALEIWAQSADDISVVVTDVMMPGMSGVELVEQLRKTRPEVPVLFVSGYADYETRGDQPPLVGERFLAKPFQPEGLLAAVAQALVASEEPEPDR